MKQKLIKLMGTLLSLTLALLLMVGMSIIVYGDNAYNDYLVTTDANKEKIEKYLNTLRVTFNNHKWYIIADNSTSTTTGTVTLFAADNSFGTSQFSSISDQYGSSDVKNKLDRYLRNGGEFQEVEDCIADTDLEDVNVTGAKLYLLSFNEAFPLPRNVKNITFSGTEHGEWWTRSVDTNPGTRVIYIEGNPSGESGSVDIHEKNVTNNYGVRPALNLDLSKVSFSNETRTFTRKLNSVTVISGNNMTKTGDSGAESQTGLNGPMTSVVYTADEGYYFPVNYSVVSKNGIFVTRDSYTQITVSGTPDDDTEITLTAPKEKTKPAAPASVAAVNCTTRDKNDGKLTGVTSSMEYKEENEENWTDGTGNDITGLSPGTYYVRVKATDTAYASENRELIVEECPYYYVEISQGLHMTKTRDSGEYYQNNLYGAMTPVVYIADDGYYFPDNYFDKLDIIGGDGISVIRDSYTQITVSGTPAGGNVEIALPDAEKRVYGYKTYLVTTDDNRDKEGTELEALRVYFNGMPWYIIEDDSFEDKLGTITLLAADVGFGQSAFGQYKDTYNVSEVKRYLDAVISGTAGEGKPDFSGAADSIIDTENGKLYLLDITEANDLPENVRKYPPNNDGYWWLRSLNLDDGSSAAYVNFEGYIFTMEGVGNDTLMNVRPALKLDLSSVVFSSSSKTFYMLTDLQDLHKVLVTPGSHMTKTADSGENEQGFLYGAMTPVVYIADDGYYFPENYGVDPVNGISVSRNSATQITVSGTPTADTIITLTEPAENNKKDTPDPEPKPTPKPDPTPTPEPTPTPDPTPTPEPTPTPDPSPAPKPAPTPEPAPAPEPEKVPVTEPGQAYASPADNFAPIAKGSSDGVSGSIKDLTLDFSGVAKSGVDPSGLKMTAVKGSRFTTAVKVMDKNSVSATGGVKPKFNKKDSTASFTCKSTGTGTVTLEDGNTYTISFTVEKPKAQPAARKMASGGSSVTRSIEDLFGTRINSGKLFIEKQKHSQAKLEGNAVIIDPKEKDSIKIVYRYLNKKYKITVKVR